MINMETNVLVYGSLKYACSNHVVMERIGATCLGYESITGEFEMISMSAFPGVIQHPNSEELTSILGELYTVDDWGLSSLDAMEGHPHFYERFKFRTDLRDQSAWMYTIPRRKGDLANRTYSSASIWEPSEDEQNFWADYGILFDAD